MKIRRVLFVRKTVCSMCTHWSRKQCLSFTQPLVNSVHVYALVQKTMSVIYPAISEQFSCMQFVRVLRGVVALSFVMYLPQQTAYQHTMLLTKRVRIGRNLHYETPMSLGHSNPNPSTRNNYYSSWGVT